MLVITLTPDECNPFQESAKIIRANLDEIVKSAAFLEMLEDNPAAASELFAIFSKAA
jgi:hypothetical protein